MNIDLSKVLTLFFVLFAPLLNAQILSNGPGNFKEFKSDETGVLISAEKASVRLIVYSPNIIRIKYSQTGKFNDFSYALIAQSSKTQFVVKDEPARLLLSTDSINVIVTKTPLTVSCLTKDGKVINEDEPGLGVKFMGTKSIVHKKLQPLEKFIGLGEKTGSLNKVGKAYTFWNTDIPSYSNRTDPLYVTTPFYLGLHNSICYGIFLDNSYRTNFNFGASNDRYSSFGADGGDIDYYFIYHKSVSKIIESYTHLTGRMEMPPMWSLGFQQCRWTYYPESEVLNIAKTFRERNFPVDVLYLDIDYMDAFKVFTWNPTYFPQPKRMIDQLKDMGFKVVLIVDPGVKVEKGYSKYEEGVKNNHFLKYPDGKLYAGEVWPSWSHFPDFTNPKVREWWGNNFKGYVNDGVSGFWNDMNEPATWGNDFPEIVEHDMDGNKGSHSQAHNIYGFQMAKSTFEGAKKHLAGKRPFVLTRAGYSGVQRYSAVWTGDNIPSDEHMLLGVRLLSGMGLAGISFSGMDVGGFTGWHSGNISPSTDLFTRWMTLGTFLPFFRSHTERASKAQEPWAFGKESESITKKYVELRYKLLPYIYSSFYESTQSGLPIFRSLAIDYSFDDKVYDLKYENQFFFGSSIMVAPVVSTRDVVKVYFPKDGFYDFDTDIYYPAQQEVYVEAPITKLPVFIKEGSIMPMQSVIQNTTQKPSDTLSVHVYNGKKANTFVYYEDDGETYEYKNGQFHKRIIAFDALKKTISFDKSEGSLKSKFTSIRLVLHGFSIAKQELNAGGKKVKVTNSGTMQSVTITNSSDKISVSL